MLCGINIFCSFTLRKDKRNNMKDIYLPEIENGLRDKRSLLSNEARELGQSIISNLRLDKHISIEADKRVLGEVCRALEIESIHYEQTNSYYYHFYKDSHLESCVFVSTPVSMFEVIANAVNPRK